MESSKYIWKIAFKCLLIVFLFGTIFHYKINHFGLSCRALLVTWKREIFNDSDHFLKSNIFEEMIWNYIERFGESLGPILIQYGHHHIQLLVGWGVKSLGSCHELDHVQLSGLPLDRRLQKGPSCVVMTWTSMKLNLKSNNRKERDLDFYAAISFFIKEGRLFSKKTWVLFDLWLWPESWIKISLSRSKLVSIQMRVSMYYLVLAGIPTSVKFGSMIEDLDRSWISPLKY